MKHLAIFALLLAAGVVGSLAKASKPTWWAALGSLATFKTWFEQSVEHNQHFDEGLCDHLFDTPTQRRICRTNVAAGNAAGLVAAFDNAVHLALKECKEQFKSHRWNCPLEWDPSRWNDGFSPESVAFLEQGTKEAAFLVAAISAALTHTIAHACAIGNLTGCSCTNHVQPAIDPVLTTPAPTSSNVYSKSSLLADIRESAAASSWQWGGCAENVQFGSYMSRKFLDAPALKRLRKNSRDMLALVQLQNLLIGRRTLTSQLRVNCRCHGLSASCSVKTCFRQPSPYRTIATSLRNKYESALLASEQPELAEDAVDAIASVTTASAADIGPTDPAHPLVRNRLFRRKAKNDKPSYVAASSKRIMQFLRTHSVLRDHLVHYKKSPNFCEPSTEWPHGTRGRVCSKPDVTLLGDQVGVVPAQSDEHDNSTLSSCDTLCCGRGYESKLVYVAEPCRCEFRWCCEIKCETCWTTREVHTCK